MIFQEKIKLALALKAYWEAHGKWKKGSDKQRRKVKKVKGILGEWQCQELNLEKLKARKKLDKFIGNSKDVPKLG